MEDEPKSVYADYDDHGAWVNFGSTVITELTPTGDTYKDVDIRFRGGSPYFLEVNPLPGLSPDYGDLVIMSRKEGWAYEELILEIFRGARERVFTGGDGP